MNTYLLDLDAWIVALIVAAAMLLGWWLGWRQGWRLQHVAHTTAPTKFADATMAILGLLLAFTFSMSLAKHEERRVAVVNDSNSIGDFYTCASLLKDPVRGKLQGVVRGYVEHRLALANAQLTRTDFQQKLGEVQGVHNDMQFLVAEAINNGTPVAIPLVNTFNSLTSNHAARLSAAQNRLPFTIVLLLFLASEVAMVLVGMQQGASDEWRPAAAVAFVALVSMVIWVTLDFNQPHRGMITVSQEPLERLLAGMGK